MVAWSDPGWLLCHSLTHFPPLGNGANACICFAAEDVALATCFIARVSWDQVTCACAPCPRNCLSFVLWCGPDHSC